MNPLSERLRDVCAAHGRRVAVLDRGRAFTYAALDARVRGVEATLREAGAGPGTLVALGGARTVGRVADMLALFRVGAVPLLLCPRWPAAYGAARIAASGAALRLEEGELRVSGASPRALPGDAAYVIYTSGSSGQPKGVVVPHAGLVPVLDAQIEAFALTPTSRSLFLLGLGFDASLSDIGTALLAGATLVLEEDSACAPSRLLGTIARHGVTYADVPPAYLAHLHEEALPGCLETLVVGGEVAPAHDVRRLAERVALFNVYGPTEATICTSLGRCDPGWSRPLLGQPIAGNEYDLSPSEAEANDEGELLIAGPGLALGYLDDEALTAQRFVWRAGRRWYRTGDVVRRCADGEWAFRGRVDRQLKLRGQRVAPEEVEAALLRTGLLRAVRVSTSPEADRLVAHVEVHVPLSEPQRRELVGRLRASLFRELPTALVPDDVVVVDALPRGVTGKLMPVARPHATGAPPGTSPERAPRRTDSELPCDGVLALLGAWMGQVLSSAPLAPDDDFFDAGGTSLHALEVAARAQAADVAVSASAIAHGRTPGGAWEQRATEAGALWSVAALGEHLGDVAPLRASPAGSLRGGCVFLTGATGTLGRALLPRLLAELGTTGRVHCLVRHPDALSGARHATLSDEARVVVHVGDLREDRFGLANDGYDALARDVDVVIHLGARLSGAASLDALRAVNVEGTRRVLQLCHDVRPKALLHASTLSVFTDASPRPATCLEADDLADRDALLTPYAASKWLAERLVRRADPSEHAATIVRFGLLTGASDTGVGDPQGHLERFIRGLARLSALPDVCLAAAEHLAFDVTPLDHAADACVALLSHDRTRGGGGTYHVAAREPASLAALLHAMRAEGVALTPLPTREFFGRAGAHRDATGDVALAALSLARGVPGMLAQHRALDLFAATGAHFSLVNTSRALAAALPRGASLGPRPDPALLRRYVRAALA